MRLKTPIGIALAMCAVLGVIASAGPANAAEAPGATGTAREAVAPATRGFVIRNETGYDLTVTYASEYPAPGQGHEDKWAIAPRVGDVIANGTDSIWESYLGPPRGVALRAVSPNGKAYEFGLEMEPNLVNSFAVCTQMPPGSLFTCDRGKVGKRFLVTFGLRRA
ncbi:hypothetical protein ACFQ78_19645 [Streptomyces sp. NPDC056519]|uniref:hypothetical protein n=1 Tax=Streptomyces sp. NPDC056519 TaxID=3345849 RepID=UPI0036821031